MFTHYILYRPYETQLGDVYDSELLHGYDTRALREHEYIRRVRKAGYAFNTNVSYVAAPVIRGEEETPCIEHCPVVLPSSMVSRLLIYPACLCMNVRSQNLIANHRDLYPAAFSCLSFCATTLPLIANPWYKPIKSKPPSPSRSPRPDFRPGHWSRMVSWIPCTHRARIWRLTGPNCCLTSLITG